MSYRFMRLILFFDLPTTTLEDKREYRKFRKFLIKKGFLMIQESVYVKLALNQTVASSVAASVRENRPAKGIIQMLIVTEKQYARMEYVTGNASNVVIEDDSRLVVL